IFAELGCTGSLEISAFHGLSGGKTCRAARILSASGVLNRTGLVTSGIFGRSAPAAASAVVSRRGQNHVMSASSPREKRLKLLVRGILRGGLPHMPKARPAGLSGFVLLGRKPGVVAAGGAPA